MVIASPPVRAVVRQLLESRVPSVAVLGYNEVESSVEVESLGLAVSALPGGHPAGHAPAAAAG